MSHVALLRGINVGGRNKLPMKELAALFEAAGCRDVRTYIQSGNVIFEGDAKAASKRVSAAIGKTHGYEIPIVTRSAAELEAIVAGNPYDVDPSTIHVAFLADRPRAATLDPDRSPGDRFTLAGRELYLHLPNGVARTKLTNAWLDRQLGTTSTVRNWKTTLKLLELTR